MSSFRQKYDDNSQWIKVDLLTLSTHLNINMSPKLLLYPMFAAIAEKIWQHVLYSVFSITFQGYHWRCLYFVVVNISPETTVSPTMHQFISQYFPTLSVLPSPSPFTPTEDGIRQNGSQNLHFSFTFFMWYFVLMLFFGGKMKVVNVDGGTGNLGNNTTCKFCTMVKEQHQHCEIRTCSQPALWSSTEVTTVIELQWNVHVPLGMNCNQFA